MHTPKWCFRLHRGNYRDRSSVLTSLKRFTKGAEFKHMTLHKLRCCNETMLLNMGIKLKAISDHLGHCDINVTADIYADVLNGMKRTIADAVKMNIIDKNKDE